jgi:ribonuclease Z
MNVYGPKGTAEMLNNLRKAFAFDIRMRVEDDKRSEEGSKFLTSEIQQGVIYEKNGVKVIAIEVDHFPVVPAFGYRIEYKGHAVVLSGDTRYSENLTRFAKGTDLIIHEVAIAPDSLSKSDPQYNILMHHTTPEQAAKVFNNVQPGLAVYSHIVKIHGLTEDDIMKKTKEHYAGKVIMGEDLMSFSIGDTIAVNKWKNQ